MGSIVGGMMFGVRLGTRKMAALFRLRDDRCLLAFGDTLAPGRKVPG